MSLHPSSITVRVCECGISWSGGNTKYCPAGHAYDFTERTYVPASERDFYRDTLDTMYVWGCKRPDPQLGRCDCERCVAMRARPHLRSAA